MPQAGWPSCRGWTSFVQGVQDDMPGGNATPHTRLPSASAGRHVSEVQTSSSWHWAAVVQSG